MDQKNYMTPIGMPAPGKLLLSRPVFNLYGGFLKWWVFPPNHPLKNRGFHHFHHPFWGTTIFGNTHIFNVPGNQHSPSPFEDDSFLFQK